MAAVADQKDREQALEPLKAEQESRLQIPSMDNTRVGALIENERNTLSLRSEH